MLICSSSWPNDSRGWDICFRKGSVRSDLQNLLEITQQREKSQAEEAATSFREARLPPQRDTRTRA